MCRTREGTAFTDTLFFVKKKKTLLMKQPDMKFVQNFTPPDFEVKNFTPSISPNFNSFSKKKHKK